MLSPEEFGLLAEGTKSASFAKKIIQRLKPDDRGYIATNNTARNNFVLGVITALEVAGMGSSIVDGLIGELDHLASKPPPRR